MSYKGELDICIHCGVMMPEHNFEHLARDCFPQQIDELTAERDRLRNLVGNVQAMISDWDVEKMDERHAVLIVCGMIEMFRRAKAALKGEE
jgi:NAD(P)H-flavin reductase